MCWDNVTSNGANSDKNLIILYSVKTPFCDSDLNTADTGFEKLQYYSYLHAILCVSFLIHYKYDANTFC
jgi:hypothetical protein